MAQQSVLIHCIYAIFFTVALHLSATKFGLSVLRKLVIYSGYLLVLFGLANVYNFSQYQDAILHMRLSGVFQYANAYSAYLLALLFISLVHLENTQKSYFKLVQGVMLIPIFVSLLLTYSRGVFLILPVVLILILPLLEIRKQISLFINLIVVTLVSLLILNNIISIMSLDDAGKLENINRWSSLSLIFVSSLLVSVICFLSHKLVERITNNNKSSTKTWRFSKLYISCFIVLILAAAIVVGKMEHIVKVFPERLQIRLETISASNNSITERFNFYQDAFSLLKDYPVFGAGGGAWFTLYEQYKQNPYTSRQAHSFLMQELVETGLVGFTIIFSIICLIFLMFVYRYFKNRKEGYQDSLIFYVAFLCIFLHSLIDFDLSYIYLSVLIYICLGVLAGSSGLVINFQPANSSKNGDSSIKKSTWMRFSYSTLIIIISISLFITSVKLIKANTLYNNVVISLRNSPDLNEVNKNLNAAIELNPNNYDYYFLKNNILLSAYEQTKNEAYITEAQKNLEQNKVKEPFSHSLMESKYSILMKKNDMEAAFNFLIEQKKYFPWDITIYDRLIGLGVEVGKIKSEYWDQSILVFEEFAAKITKLEQAQDYKITANMYNGVGLIYYFKSNNKNAIQYLKLGLSGPYENIDNKNLNRLYLALTLQENQLDKKLYDKFIAKYPEEKQAIDTKSKKITIGDNIEFIK
ncbi:O-antigen ligase family protein [Paenibacillus alginolyticus]|nr:O-antigen ligase family protein [Paenibacillus alginolyticus]MEC0143755.1 O-antigen ligase family protein [Paenibacillus alginolyticus]